MKKFLNHNGFIINETIENTMPTINEIKNTKECKNILAKFPVELNTNLADGYAIKFYFGIKPSHVFDYNYNSKHLHSKIIYYGGIELHRTAILNNRTIFDVTYTSIPPFKSHDHFDFDPTTLDGWKKALIKTKEIFEKIFKIIKEREIIVNLERPVDYRDIPFEIQKEIVNKVITDKFEWNDAKIYVSPNAFINNLKFQKHLLNKTINKELKWEDIKNYISPKLYDKYKGRIFAFIYGIT